MVRVMESKEFIRLGIIGIGNMGSEHCRLILGGKCPEVRLAAVADLRPERLEWARNNLPEGTKVYADGTELIRGGDCDAVLIAVPHYRHPEMAEAALRAGLHVLCEKPAAVQASRAAQMIRAAEESGKTLTFMFNQRTNCVYRAMKAVLESGELGALKRMNWIVTDWYRTQRYYDSGSWRATWAGEGGGVLLNQCPHQLDLFQWILGMPEKVQAFMRFGAFHDIEVEDDVTALMTWPDGHTGVFITSTGDPHGSNRFEVQMDGAQLVVENDQLRVYELEALEQDWTKTNKQPFGSVPGRSFIAETDGENPQHRGVLTRWAAAIREGTPLVAGGAEGINGLTLANAMHLSAFTGEAVTLPLDEARYEQELKARAASSRRKTTRAVFADTSGSFAGAH